MENKEQFSRFIIFIVLAIGILTLWQKIFPPPPKPQTVAMEKGSEMGTQERAETPMAGNPEAAAHQTPTQTKSSDQRNKLFKTPTTDTISLSTPMVQYEWNLRGGGYLLQTTLKEYKGPAGTETENQLLSVGDQKKTFFLNFSDSQLAVFNGAPFAVVKNDQEALILEQESPNFKVRKFFKPAQNSYAFDWKVTVESKKPLNGTLGNMYLQLNYVIP